MASFKKVQPFAYRLGYGDCFFLDSGIPLFTSRKIWVALSSMKRNEFAFTPVVYSNVDYSF